MFLLDKAVLDTDQNNERDVAILAADEYYCDCLTKYLVMFTGMCSGNRRPLASPAAAPGPAN